MKTDESSDVTEDELEEVDENEWDNSWEDDMPNSQLSSSSEEMDDYDEIDD